MAVTRIWRIRGNAGSPLDYVSNKEKTKNPFTEQDRQALADVIAYAANEDKTEQRFFTKGINCNTSFAKDQFETTKKRFDKEGGIVAYHCYQSFNEGELTPAEAHAKALSWQKSFGVTDSRS
jgi:L-cysteine desulfidase